MARSVLGRYTVGRQNVAHQSVTVWDSIVANYAGGINLQYSNDVGRIWEIGISANGEWLWTVEQDAVSGTYYFCLYQGSEV